MNNCHETVERDVKLSKPGENINKYFVLLTQQEEIRHIPTVMLTAKGEEIDRVVGFELGADDYVTKPFNPRELVLRLKAVLKRVHASEESYDIIKINGLTIDKPRSLTQKFR